MTETEPLDHGPWPLRPFLLLALGAALGLAFHLLMRGTGPWDWTDNPFRFAAATAIASAGIVFAFSLERIRWLWAVLFAAAAGLVLGLISWFDGTPGGWGANEGWQFFSALLAIAIAVPLFQSARDSGELRFGYRAVHTHAWTNIVLWFAAWAFVGAAFLLCLLLSQLFELIGLDLLRRLLDKRWADWMLVGGTLGAAVGLLRDRDQVLALLQRVATGILSVLTPVLAFGLVAFVVALPFTGLAPLWDHTRSTTPILLAAIAGAAVLTGATIGSAPDEESGSPILRGSAAALAAVLLPLALVAALSVGKRIGQYGYTPDRLWAGVFVAIAAATAAAYLIALVRGRRAWMGALRRANLRLAVAICLLALFLALPVVSFGALSARDQFARLQSGRVRPDSFDWRAMRFDFGPAGRSALARLRDRGATPEIRALALTALGADRPSALPDRSDEVGERRNLAAIRVVPAPAALPADLRQRLAAEPHCGELGLCLLVYRPGDDSAALVAPSTCVGEAGPDVSRRAGEPCQPQVTLFRARGGRWARVEPEPMWGPDAVDPSPAEVTRRRERAEADLKAIQHNEVDIRKVERRQVFVAGRPVGEPFE